MLFLGVVQDERKTSKETVSITDNLLSFSAIIVQKKYRLVMYSMTS